MTEDKRQHSDAYLKRLASHIVDEVQNFSPEERANYLRQEEQDAKTADDKVLLSFIKVALERRIRILERPARLPHTTLDL